MLERVYLMVCSLVEMFSMVAMISMLWWVWVIIFWL